ncbi:D-amino-acid oxidase, partial [Lecanoromycetidae sp. Uapishka_2]
MTLSEKDSRPFLQLGTDFSAFPTPLRKPDSSSPKILVIGAGVSSLVSSWMLLDKGFQVTIVAREFASFGKAQRLTSQIGGALWEFPSAPCGPRISRRNLENVRRWALESYATYSALAKDPKLSSEFGVKLRKNLCCFPVPIDTHGLESERMEAIRKAGIHGFRCDKSLLDEYDHEISRVGVADAFEHLSPVTDTDQAMRFLTNLVRCKGAQFQTETLGGDLREHEDELLAKYNVDAIVNASGLGARELASDLNVRPARGGLLRIINDGMDFEKITHALVVNNSEPEDYNIVFIVPRNDNILILGTFIEFDKWETDLTPDTPVMRTMRKQCESLVPALKKARLDPEYPMAQGLRPVRKGDVKIEREQGMNGLSQSRIVHAYGHGIGGWTLAFGSGAEVAFLVEQIVKANASL